MNNQSRYLDMLQQSINLSKEIKIPNLKWNSINYKYQNESEMREIIKIVHGEHSMLLNIYSWVIHI